MHIAIVNQFHQMPGSGGLARFSEMARCWRAAGCDVTIVCSTIDHASGQVPDMYTKGRRHQEANDAATVWRTRTYAGDKKSAAGRILRDMSFAWSASVNGGSLVRDADVLIASSPPLFVGIPGAKLAKKYDMPLVFEVRDLWPDIPVEFGALSGPAAKMAFKLEDWTYRNADHIVGVTPGISERIAAKGVQADKLSTVPNGADLDLFKPLPDRDAARQELGWSGRFVVLYAGVLGPAQALDQLLRAADRLRDLPEVLFVLVGNGSEKTMLVQTAKRLGLDNVRFIDQQPRESIPRLLGAADVGVAALKDMPTFRYLYPAKVFEVLASETPILLAANGVVADLVMRSGGGLVADAEDDAKIAEHVRYLVDHEEDRANMGRNGRAFVEREFDRRRIAADYLRTLEALA